MTDALRSIILEIPFPIMIIIDMFAIFFLILMLTKHRVRITIEKVTQRLLSPAIVFGNKNIKDVVDNVKKGRKEDYPIWLQKVGNTIGAAGIGVSILLFFLQFLLQR